MSTAGEESRTILASFTPSDSFLDLTNTLHNLLCYRVGGIVTWNEDPAETELRFSILAEVVELEVYFSRITAAILEEVNENRQ